MIGREHTAGGRDAGRRRVMARGAVGAVAVVLAVPWATAGPLAAQEDPGPAPDIYEARAEAGGVTDALTVPAQFETFTPYSLSEAQNGSSHGLHAVFYPGFLLSAAAFQQGFPPPPGTTETLYPQGPTEGQADVLPLPMPPGSPGAFARSSGRSGPDGASGEATYGGFTPSADMTFRSGRAATSVAAAGGVVRSVAEVVMQHVRLGDVLVIDSVVVKAEAVATGVAGQADATGSVVFNGATVMGVPVVLTPTGLSAGDAGGDLPASTPVDEVLAQAGISVRRLPDERAVSPDGTESRLSLGGIEVRFDQPTQEFGLGFTLGRVSVRARAVDEATPAGTGVPVDLPIVTVEQPAAVPEPVAAPADPVVLGETSVAPAEPTFIERVRRIRVPGPEVVAAPPGPVPAAANPPASAPSTPFRPAESAQQADWSGVSGLIALAAPAALVIRRVLRFAAAP